MGSNLAITKEIENYINNHSLELTSIQKEIISYNNTLGDIKRMQISISQCLFLHLIIKTANIKKILEIGTFTGLSGLTMSLALPNEGKLVTLVVKGCDTGNKSVSKDCLGKLDVFNDSKKAFTLEIPHCVEDEMLFFTVEGFSL